MKMVSKVLKKMEVLRGFIHIPTRSKSELIGNTPLPCSTMLNGNPARLDKYGRIWSSYLKNRFSIGTEVELSKTDNGYKVTPSASKQEFGVSEMEQQEDNMLVRPNLESETEVSYRMLEGDCLKYLNESSINNIHLTFLNRISWLDAFKTHVFFSYLVFNSSSMSKTVFSR